MRRNSWTWNCPRRMRTRPAGKGVELFEPYSLVYTGVPVISELYRQQVYTREYGRGGKKYFTSIVMVMEFHFCYSNVMVVEFYFYERKGSGINFSAVEW